MLIFETFNRSLGPLLAEVALLGDLSKQRFKILMASDAPIIGSRHKRGVAAMLAMTTGAGQVFMRRILPDKVWRPRMALLARRVVDRSAPAGR